jgi:hypothetical protein
VSAVGCYAGLPMAVPAQDAKSQSHELKQLLRAELQRRQERNRRYSLRAFARQLDVDPSSLAKILGGKRALGPRAIRMLGARIGMEPPNIEACAAAAAARRNQDPYVLLDQQTFEVIADWHHLALLELIRLDGFRPDLGWVAKKLGLSRKETQLLVDRLVATRLLEITPGGSWIDRLGRMSALPKERTSEAYCRFQKQVFAQATDALESVPLQERDQTTIVLAADSALLPEARERIKRFRRSLARFLSNGRKRDRLFNLSISLFPVAPSNHKKAVRTRRSTR